MSDETKKALTPPEIRSEGLPPERHAARVVAEMCRWLAAEQQAVVAVIRSRVELAIGPSGMGNPKAQARVEARMRRDPIAARWLLNFTVMPGKHGRYGMIVTYCSIVRPDDAGEIAPGDPIPQKPWVCCMMTGIWPKDHEKDRDLRLVTLTHHAMQRLAERCAARTVEDLRIALVDLAIWRLDAVNPDRSVTHHVPVAGGQGVAIVESVDEHDWLVKTILPAGANG